MILGRCWEKQAIYNCFQSTWFSKLCATIAPSLVSWLQMRHHYMSADYKWVTKPLCLRRAQQNDDLLVVFWPGWNCDGSSGEPCGLHTFATSPIMLTQVWTDFFKSKKGTDYQIELATSGCWSHCPLQEAKSTVDTEKSTWKTLLDEFEEEGHPDLHINGHDHCKATSETGGDSSILCHQCHRTCYMNLRSETRSQHLSFFNWLHFYNYMSMWGEEQWRISPKATQANCIKLFSLRIGIAF